MMLLLWISFCNAAAIPRFKSSITAIPITQRLIMQANTWHAGCPIPFDELAAVKLSYWGYDQKPHQGELIVNKALAPEVAKIFAALYARHFPIAKMETMDIFHGDDDAAMAANNTSSFNCRAVAGHPGIFSQHSYGRAIDINTLVNPYVKAKLILPPAGARFADRKQDYPGKITKDSFIYKIFTENGWDWGGNWHDLQDYQHFEKRSGGEKRNLNGYG